MQKRIRDNLATKLEGLADPTWDPKQRHNSDGADFHGGINMKVESLILPPSDITLPTWSPAPLVKGYGIANPISNVPPSKTAKGAKGIEQLHVANGSVPKRIGDHLATKLEGLTEPNWDPKQKHDSDGPECHGGINMKGESLILPPSDITLSTWLTAPPVKGYGIANPISNFPEKVALALEKSSTIANDYLGGKMKQLGDVKIASILPQPERIPTPILGKKGSGDPRPHVSIPISAPHGALCSKTTISSGFSPREKSLNTVICTLGRKGDRGTMLGAKVPDETLLRKGMKLAKV